MKNVGPRLQSAMERRQLDQTALAAAIGVTPGTISLILAGKTRQSKHLPEIAAALGVSYDWLIGREEKKDSGGAPAPTDAVHHVMMAVALPPRRALVRMFDVLLEALPPEAGRDEQAGLLADWLPVALSQIRDLLPASPPAPAFPPQADALVDHGSRS